MSKTVPQIERFCISCKHSLRGISSRRCPECGRAFDPNDPRTTAPNTTYKLWLVLEAACRFLICASGFLVALSFIVSMVGTGRMLIWMLAFLVSPVLLFLLLVIMLPCVALSRRYRISGVVLLALLTSIVWTDWPLYISFAFHKSAMNKLAAQAMAGEVVVTPQRVGMFRFHNIKHLPNGNVGFQLTGGPVGGVFLVRCVPDAQYVWDWWDWQTKLGGGWYHVHED